MKLPLCIFKWSDLSIPANTAQWKDPTQRLLIAEIKGEGTFRALGMRLKSTGIWFGFQVDQHPFMAVHNAACIEAMGLIGAAGGNMPCWIPSMRNAQDLTLAYNRPFVFGHKLQLYMGNSDKGKRSVLALHVYFEADPKKIEIGGFLHPTWVVDK